MAWCRATLSRGQHASATPLIDSVPEQDVAARAATRIAAVVVVAAVALILATPTALGTSYQLLRHARCGLGAAVSQSLFWTPVVIVDSPTGGNNSSAVASGWAPFETPVYLSEDSGEAAGGFTLDTWALYQQTQVWSWGAGAVPACSGQVAIDLSRTPAGPASSGAQTAVLLAPGATSDAGVPHQVNLTAPNGSMYSSVLFFANYSRGYGNLSFHQITGEVIVGGAGQTTTSSQISTGATLFVVVPFPSSGGATRPYALWLSGVVSMSYTLVGNWSGCVQWWDRLNPMGTGLSFGPPPASPNGFCQFP